MSPSGEDLKVMHFTLEWAMSSHDNL